jgi:cyclophilin family peptidyl-prolyl cis-trans isomerase
MTWWFPRTLSVALVAAGLAGCGAKTETKVPAADEPAAEAKQPAGKTVVATPVSRSSALRDRLHQAFADAVRNADDPPPGDAVRPPDETVSKKPVHKILDAVKSGWDDIRFTTPTGAKIEYKATVETSEGTIEIALFPEQAPNHVRNFVALAKAGYYDELFFERIRHDQNEAKQELHLIEAGCPLGTGAASTGSIGYWLKQEFTPADKISHDEGVIGACRGEEADSAATRFYITLTKAPFLDGNYTVFGKVVAGLDVLRKIGQAPVVVDDEGSSKPEKPIVIRKVTVTTAEAK